MKTTALLLLLAGFVVGCGPQTAEQRENTAMLLNALVGMQQNEAIRTQRPANVNIEVYR